jgi:hypothetical protein
MRDDTFRLLPSTIVAIGLVLAAVAFGLFFYHSRVEDTSIRVVGAATKRIDSDVVKWRITLGRNVGLQEVPAGYTLINGDLQTVVVQLSSSGIQRENITIQPINAQPTYRQGGEIGGYMLQQGLFVISNDVATIERLALNPAGIFEKGVVVQSSTLEYYSSQLSEIKRELLAAATDDARKRAEAIAGTSRRGLGRMTSARAGVFQITEPYSTEVRDYGIYNPTTRQKDISVTVNAAFSME